MDARSKNVNQILKSNEQYLIPFFQRSYSWEKKHWKRLTDDVKTLLAKPPLTQHFLGPLVCTPGNQFPGEVSSYQLIDGQQRLTTLSLLITAFRDVCLARNFKELKEMAEEEYLVHKWNSRLQRYKVIPRLEDREVFTRLIDGKEREGKSSPSITEAYDFFRQWIENLEPADPEAMKKLLTAIGHRLSLVVITITGENPYEIFESLNSTGLPLKESDLIRNYVFMNVPLEQQEEFSREHWEPFESVLREKVGDQQLDPTDFYRDYLMRTGRYSRKKSTFVDFKEQTRDRELKPESLTRELRSYLGHARLIKQFDVSETPELNGELRKLLDLEVSTANPLVLALLDAHKAGKLPLPDLLECLRIISGFVLRRYVCGQQSRAYGRWFCLACKGLGDNPLANLTNFLKEKGFPSDETFKSSFQKMKLYNSQYARAVLEGIELYIQAACEPVLLHGCSIEHVLPQSVTDDADGKAWQAALGNGWKKVHDEWLHTPGNLTLVGEEYNKAMQKKPFADKKPKLAASVVYLNKHFGKPEPPEPELTSWTEETIKARGMKLAELAAEVWAGPPGGSDDSGEFPADHPVNLSDLIRVGLLHVGDKIFMGWKPKGSERRVFEGTIKESGEIDVLGETCTNLSKAAVNALKAAGSNRSTENGWQKWKTAGGVQLLELRKQYLQSLESRDGDA